MNRNTPNLNTYVASENSMQLFSAMHHEVLTYSVLYDMSEENSMKEGSGDLVRATCFTISLTHVVPI